MDKMKTIRYSVLIVILAALAAYTNLLRFRPVKDPELPPLDAIPTTVEDYSGFDGTATAPHRQTAW